MLKTLQLLVFTLHLVYYILLHQQLTFKTDILGQYFTQYWSDLYYTAMFNSSVSTQCISLLLCTLLTECMSRDVPLAISDATGQLMRNHRMANKLPMIRREVA